MQKLINLRGFKTNVHNIANSVTQLTDLEAQSLLLDELLNHRLKDTTPTQLEHLIDSNDKKFLWKITFASKDVIRKELHKLQQQQDLTDKLEANTEDTYTIDLDKSSRLSEEEVLKVVNLLPSLFRDSNTQTFVALVLMFGKTTTQEKLQLTDKQFERKMRTTKDYCESHRQQFINILTSPQDRKLMKEEKLIDKLLNAHGDFEMQELFNTYEPEVNDLVGLAYNPYITYQARFIRDYHHAPEYDKVAFRHYLLTRLQEIEKRLAK